MDEGQTPRKRWLTTKRLVCGAGVLLVIIILGVTSIIWLAPRLSSGPPKALIDAQKTVSFPLFYAHKTPKGFTFNADMVSATSQAAIYSYSYDHGKRLAMSVQPPTSDIDATSLRSTSQFTTTIGRVYVLDFNDRTGAVITGDKSWVILNAPDKIATDDLRDFIDSLQPVRD